MAIKITGTTVINDSRGIENISDIDQFVRKPTITSPTEGSTTNAGLSPTIVGSVYAPFFSADARDYREFQVDLATGDFSNPIRTNQVNDDSWTVSPSLDPDTEHKIRIRDVSNNGVVSEFSDEITFTTANVFVDEPTVSVEDGPSDVPENPTISTSAFSVTNGSDTHESTDWEVIRTSDSVTVFESLNDTSNLTSITVTTSLDESEEYEFRARHRGTTFGTSSYGSVTATTLDQFFAPTTLGEPGGGGFYMGTICADGTCYYLVVAPNATGCACCDWKTNNDDTCGACSSNDGYANTYPALENSTHPAGNWTATRTINGFSDWYLPTVEELQLFYDNGAAEGSGDPLPSGEDFEGTRYWSSQESPCNESTSSSNYSGDNTTGGPYHVFFAPGSPYASCYCDFRRECPAVVRAVRRVPV